MIPTLYEKNITTFTGNGLGRLSDAISCVVTEERNGSYELLMEYPISGIHYDELSEERIIYAEPAQTTDPQPFRIYKISRPLNGIVTVYGEHISYLLNKVVVKPFTASSCAGALAAIPTNALNSCPFTFSTDKQVSGTFTCDVPKAVRGMLGGETGSILDVYGKGDYEFNGFNVILHTNRGADNGVTIRYGKNLTELVRDRDISNCYTGIAPFWKGTDDGTVVTLTEGVIYSTHRSDFAYDIIKPVDMSEYWQEAPTEAQLRSRATSYVTNNEGWEINDHVKVSFAPLWQTEEYKDFELLEEVHMCDSVTIIYTALGVTTKTRVIKTEYDVLNERYLSVELGTSRNTLGQTIADDLRADIEKNQAIALNSVQHQAELLKGGLGGYMVINTDSDGKPTELLFMDTDDKTTATQCLRINMNGIGFSPGYNATPTTAWTLDGVFNASYITTGTMSANRVRAGTLESTNGQVSLNLDSGVMTFGTNALVINATNFQLDASGILTASGASINGVIYSYSADGTLYARLREGGFAISRDDVFRVIINSTDSNTTGIVIRDASGNVESSIVNGVGTFYGGLQVTYNGSNYNVGYRLYILTTTVNQIADIVNNLQTTVSGHTSSISSLNSSVSSLQSTVSSHSTSISNLQTAYDNLVVYINSLHGIS